MKQTKQIPLFKVELSPEEEILQCWNQAVKGIQGIPVHKSIQSKVQISNDFQSAQLYTLIHDARLQHTDEEIKESIRNYGKVIGSEKYYYEYKFKSFGFFLHSEKGLEQFLSVNEPLQKFQRTNWNPFAEIRNNLDFIEFDSTNKKNPLNTGTNTYLGVNLKVIETIEPEKMYKEDFLPNFRQGTFRYGQLVWLEECIASLLYKKENLNLLKKLISIHRKVSEKFKKTT